MFQNFSGFRIKAKRIGGAALALYNYIARLQDDIKNCDEKFSDLLNRAIDHYSVDRPGVVSECLTGPLGADGFLTRKTTLQIALNSPELYDLYNILIVDPPYPGD